MPALQNLLLFAEDPGAVNCIAPLATELRRDGVEVDLIGDGLGEALFTQRGLSSRRAPLMLDASELLKCAPQAIIVGTSENLDSCAFDMVSIARGLGLPSVAVVDSPANAHMRFRGHSERPLHHAPNWLLVPDDIVARAYAALGFPAENIRTVGHPSHDEMADAKTELDRAGRAALRNRHFPKAGSRPVLTFISEISTGLDPGQFRRSEGYSLEGRRGSNLRTEIVVEELAEALAALELQGSARPWLVLRRHPKETSSDLRDHLEIFDQISAGGSPREIVYASDVVAGMTSMLLAEAGQLGATCLSILPRQVEGEWLPEIRDGVIPSAYTRQDVVTRLGDALRAPRRSISALQASETSVSRMINALREMVA